MAVKMGTPWLAPSIGPFDNAEGIPQDNDVVIIGAGHTGLIIAWLLTKAGHKVVILEQKGALALNALALGVVTRIIRPFRADLSEPSGNDPLAENWLFWVRLLERMGIPSALLDWLKPGRKSVPAIDGRAFAIELRQLVGSGQLLVGNFLKEIGCDHQIVPSLYFSTHRWGEDSPIRLMYDWYANQGIALRSHLLSQQELAAIHNGMLSGLLYDGDIRFDPKSLAEGICAAPHFRDNAQIFVRSRVAEIAGPTSGTMRLRIGERWITTGHVVVATGDAGPIAGSHGGIVPYTRSCMAIERPWDMPNYNYFARLGGGPFSYRLWDPDLLLVSGVDRESADGSDDAACYEELLRITQSHFGCPVKVRNQWTGNYHLAMPWKLPIIGSVSPQLHVCIAPGPTGYWSLLLAAQIIAMAVKGELPHPTAEFFGPGLDVLDIRRA